MNNETNGGGHFQTTQPTAYDRAYLVASGFLATRETTVTVPTIAHGVATYTIQTFRKPEAGDDIFIIIAGPEGLQRIHLPARVANAIAAQREALTARSRSRAAKDRADKDKAAGVVPGFMRARAAGVGPAVGAGTRKRRKRKR